MHLALDALETPPQGWFVHLTPSRTLSREEYLAFVEANPELRIERTAEGEVIVMPPTRGKTGRLSMEIGRQVANWAVADGRGATFDSSTGFDLPNGANRSPDVSWVPNFRGDALTPEEQRNHYPLCPDFVIELRSDSDRLPQLRAKMQEYIDNGSLHGWLIVDPIERGVHIYRPGRGVEILAQPAAVSGDPEMPGLALDLTLIWK